MAAPPLKGQVRIRVEGKQPERFLNLCEKQSIEFRDIRFCEKEGFTARIGAADFFRLKGPKRKTQVKIRILRKEGLLFELKKGKNRKSFLAGILCTILILLFLHSRLWLIRIRGNESCSTQEILKVLREDGVSVGINARDVDCIRVTELLRKKFPQITWASAARNGIGLFIVIREEARVLTEPPVPDDPCDLVADASGTIVSIVTRSGYPKVKPGDVCKKGDILVLGTFPLQNDEQEVLRYEQVHADAEIWISQELYYEKRLPLKIPCRIPTGEVREGFFLHAGKTWMFPGIFRRKKGREEGAGEADPVTWLSCRWESPFYLAENLKLPILVGKERQIAYRRETITLEKEEMEALLWKFVQEYEQNLMEKGLQISENNVKIRVDAHSGTSSGTITVLRKVGEERPVLRESRVG